MDSSFLSANTPNLHNNFLSLTKTNISMASSIKKVNMISQIVRLRQNIQRWKTKSFARRKTINAGSSDESETGSNRCRTPSGSVAVLAGPARHRFVIPTRFLNLPIFVDLLQQTEEEFGFQIAGPLVLPCEPGFLEEVLRFLDEDEERFRGLGLDGFLGLVEEMGFDLDPSTCKESAASSFTPLLSKTRVLH